MGDSVLTHFHVRDHVYHPSGIVEVWRDGKFVASIYGHRDGIRVVSKHLRGVCQENSQPPSVVVRLKEEV